MYENDITGDGQEGPEHQEILRGHAAHAHLIVHPVKQRIRADAPIRCFPRAFRNQLVAMTIRACIVAMRPQSCEACQQNDNQQGTYNQPLPPIGLCRSDRNMIRAPRQGNRCEHEGD